jgi:hypothetical protein
MHGRRHRVPEGGTLAARNNVATSSSLETIETSQQSSEVRGQRCVDEIGRRDAKHVADGGKNDVAVGLFLAVIRKTERADMAGPQHCCSFPRTSAV